MQKDLPLGSGPPQRHSRSGDLSLSDHHSPTNCKQTFFLAPICLLQTASAASSVFLTREWLMPSIFTSQPHPLSCIKIPVLFPPRSSSLSLFSSASSIAVRSSLAFKSKFIVCLCGGEMSSAFSLLWYRQKCLHSHPLLGFLLTEHHKAQERLRWVRAKVPLLHHLLFNTDAWGRSLRTSQACSRIILFPNNMCLGSF